MNKNEIKKAFYKEKPTAVFTGFTDDGRIFFKTTLKNKIGVEFKVPKKEGENFDDEMPAQLLIRWMN